MAPRTTRHLAATTAGNEAHKPLPETYAALVSSLRAFLVVSIHQILFLRSIYPQSTFIPARLFNHPVRQSRHPKVCDWVNNACAAVEYQMLRSTVAAVSIVLTSISTNCPLEKYTFDLAQMPHVAFEDINVPFDRTPDDQAEDLSDAHPATTIIDLEVQYRAVLARLASACARLSPLPPKEEYLPTLHIELAADADAPAGISQEDQLWIPVEPESSDTASTGARQSTSPSKPFQASKQGVEDQSGFNQSRLRPNMVAIRKVDAGEMKLEVWVEESKSKFDTIYRIQTGQPV
ncbi:hypothetical protein FQN57_005044 [Myotisia sp. PD_48]|nr:hypothetical protein FQN57_005044 [Myotisia sp. PD_48]